ncbi:MAG TPA: PIN domain-containing protein [Spirochaetota bacterium]|mgnify:CR=1 FL=1|nr:PIN domain-containing protein [Spirochaetota bacterium]
MILVDTSVWIDHFRSSDEKLKSLLISGKVVCHPFVTGEIACGFLKNRGEIIGLLQALPQLPVLELDEYLFFIDNNSLTSRGIGFVDINLLASVKITGNLIWTRDKRLNEIAAAMNLAV